MGASVGDSSQQQAAVFVDFENLLYGLVNWQFRGDYGRALDEALSCLDRLRSELHERGAVMVMGRAYSAFDERPGSEAAHSLALLGFDPQYVIAKKQKNSADLQLSLDLMEVMLTRADITLFVIVGGDRDFIPISRKVLEAARELLIVSLPEVTSGDLMDRVGPSRFLDIGKLHVDPADEPVELPQLDPSPVPSSPTPAKVVGFIDPESLEASSRAASMWTPISDEDAANDERRERCLSLILRQARNYSGEVWLSPFLKNEMAEEFSDLTHPQRRRLINALKDMSIVRIEQRESQTHTYPYSVLIPNSEHPEVRRLWSA